LPTIKSKKIRVVKSYTGDLKHIKADRKIIRLILQNLISNAAKYTPHKGEIELTLQQKLTEGASTLSIKVRDSGVGIPKSQQAKIFTKLFRADNIKPLDTEGTGLGLYLVKSFVDLCKGKIWFKSKEGKGTLFYIELPLQN